VNVDTTSWNRIRDSVGAPLYEALTAPLQALGLSASRKRAFDAWPRSPAPVGLVPRNLEEVLFDFFTIAIVEEPARTPPMARAGGA